MKNKVLRKGRVINENKYSFKYNSNKISNKIEEETVKIFDKKKNDISKIDMNKRMSPDKKEENLESTSLFKDEKKNEIKFENIRSNQYIE